MSLQVDAAYQAFDVLRSELLVAAVPPEAWPSFVRSSYDRNQLFRSSAHNARFWDWEQRAIERFFPSPPATILVGGAGAGREVLALVALGYRVVAFDPAGDLVRHGRTIMPPDDVLAFEIGGYEELVEGSLDIERFGPFDAVVLGWGSLSHVGSPEVRQRLPGVLRRLSPVGPVLLSWIAAKPAGRRRDSLRNALALAGLRRNDGTASYRPHMGFVHSPTPEALQELAASGSYEVAHVDTNVPCAVWVPR